MLEDFRARLRPQLKLALLGDCACRKTLADLADEARSSGLTGAEIDAALAGRSFEARAAAVLSFACAIKFAQPSTLERARHRALRYGLSHEELAAVTEEAKHILASLTP